MIEGHTPEATIDVEALNSLEPRQAAERLRTCCASAVWVDRMVAARPFHDSPSVLAAAEQTWWDLSMDDWIEAFSAQVDADTDQIEHETAFGYPYVVFGVGRTDAERGDAYRERMSNDPLAELVASAGEQARITNLNLRRLLGLV